MDTYQNIVKDAYNCINNIKNPTSDIYQIAADFYSNSDITNLSPKYLMMSRIDLTNLLIDDILKQLKKRHVRFKNINALNHYVKNNLKLKIKN